MKPRISRTRVWHVVPERIGPSSPMLAWICRDAFECGIGATPRDAFDNWQKARAESLSVLGLDRYGWR